VVLLLGWRYLRASRRWAWDRLEMTDDLVERMAGHRTRLAQEPPEQWHEAEDQEVARYLDTSTRMDRTGAVLIALAPRGWLILGLLALAGSFVTGVASPGALAVILGGIVLAEQAFQRLTLALWNLVGAAVAWRQVAPVFQAAARPEAHGAPVAAVAGRAGRTVLEAVDLVFRYQDRSEPVLRGCSLRVTEGDKLILEGPSGGGKSTLASLLAGLREPASGLLLAGGFDRRTLGADGWRRVIAAAPQFHENHVITGPLAFNLLMGRPGLLGDRDVEEAETVCRELGLGELLDRMPAGIMQLVGETGWQLSHGERSRLYLARALLQQAGIVLLDESFAALDPENLRRAMECVVRRARTVILIAHP